MDIALSDRADLLDLIDKAVSEGTQQERLDLLIAAGARIRRMNTEHDAVCETRAAAVEEAETMRRQLAAGIDSASLAL